METVGHIVRQRKPDLCLRDCEGRTALEEAEVLVDKERDAVGDY
jgi:hypothetical protein